MVGRLTPAGRAERVSNEARFCYQGSNGME